MVSADGLFGHDADAVVLSWLSPFTHAEKTDNPYSVVVASLAIVLALPFFEPPITLLKAPRFSQAV